MRLRAEFTQEAPEGAADTGCAAGASYPWPASDKSDTGYSDTGRAESGRADTGRADADWSDVPFSGEFVGQVWEGTDAPAPAGPWGVVELSPTSALVSLHDAVDTLQRLNELQCWADAQKARLVDRIRELYEDRNSGVNCDATDCDAGAQAQADQDEYVVSLAAEEVGALLRLPSRSARTLVEQSRLLINRHDRTLAGMESGRLSWRHAITVVEECIGVPEDLVAQFEEDLVETAEQSTVAKLTRHARGLRELLHHEAAPIRKARAVKERRVVVEPASDGMAWLSAYLPAEQACGIYNRLDTAARGLQAPDEPRTLTQLRADVLTDLLTHTCTGDTSNAKPGTGLSHANPTGTSNASYGTDTEPSSNADPDTGFRDTGFRGIGATVHITVPALTLLNQMPGTATTKDGPKQGFAVLEGYGPIDADTAARLAAHAPSFTRILTHPETGAALSIGRNAYRPPKHLQDWVRIRDKTCRHPGCNRTASATEIDHTIPWQTGGHTDHDNLACLCRKHHMLKTREQWNYSQPEPGLIHATSPAGKTYTTEPPPF